MTFGGASAPDPFDFKDQSPLQNDRDFQYRFDAMTQVHPARVSGEATAVIFMISDSTGSNTINTAYTTAANPTKCHNLNAAKGGGCWLASDPQVGSFIDRSVSPVQGGILFRIADKLISNGTYARVIFSQLGYNGAAIADWVPGGKFNQRILAYAVRARSVGLVPDFGLFLIGANDTTVGTTQAAYAASQTAVINSIRSEGIACPLVIAQSSLIPTNTTSSGIRAAQAAAPNGTDVFAGPDSDTLTSPTNRHDLQHYNATGRDALSDLFITKIGLAHP